MGNGVVFQTSGLQRNRSARISRRRRAAANRIWWLEHGSRVRFHTASPGACAMYMAKYVAKSDNVHSISQAITNISTHPTPTGAGHSTGQTEGSIIESNGRGSEHLHVLAANMLQYSRT
jgi:hypothetical protein